MSPYSYMMRLPRHRSAAHRPMGREERAAQFQPFAGLAGFDGVIGEAGRLTDERLELGESMAAALDEKLRLLREHIGERPVITVAYFVPDEKKAGGAYVTVTGPARKFREFERQIELEGGPVISIDDIYDMDGDLPRKGS